MRRSAVVAIAVAALVATVLVSSFATGVVPMASREVPVPPTPQVSGSSPKTVVLEFATGTWCPPCASADPAFGRIADEYDPTKLVVLAWHVAWGRTDPWDTPTTNGRVNWYNINTMGVPAAVVDGGYDAGHWAIGAWPDKGRNYAQIYRPMIDNEFAAGSNVMITLEGDLSATTATVNATITATDFVDPLQYPNLNVRFILYEDSLYFMGTNGEPFHRGVVLDMIEHPGFTITQGETKYVTDSFALRGESAIYAHNKLGVAVLLQSDARRAISIPGAGTGYGSEILNAARIDFVTPGVVTLREDTDADFSEPYEKLLSQANFPFRQWNNLTLGDTRTVDQRGVPTAAGLAPYSMVAWFTGSLSSGTLTAYDQTLLQGHLTAGGGGLLVSGQNLGTAVGTTAFYSDVLKASFVSDTATTTFVQGLPGDPISAPWATGNLGTNGSSPDVVAPVGGGAITFQYTGTTSGAAIRSDYDSDSRVLYMGYRYFDGTDGQRLSVLQSVVSWFDGKSGPAVTVGWPNGGEVLLSLSPYKLTWSAKDVVTPYNGVDIYYTADSVSPTWVLIASGEPNDGAYWWTPPFGIDSNKCRLKVVVHDGRGQAGEDISDADFTIGIPPHDTYNLTLQPGMNLVSLPFDAFLPNIADLFASIEPNYDWIRVYDVSNPRDPWVTWYRGGPPNELTRITRLMGFWIDITSPTPVTVTIDGMKSTTTSIPLVAGWNLVGFPSTRTDITVASLKTMFGASTMVTGPDRTSPYGTRVFADTDALATADGYWIYVQGPQTWVVSYA